MPHMTKYEPGTPSWVDLDTSDPTESASFYSELFGWTITEGPPEAGGYRMCMLDDHAVAGLGPLMNADMPTRWTSTSALQMQMRSLRQSRTTAGASSWNR